MTKRVSRTVEVKDPVARKGVADAVEKKIIVSHITLPLAPDVSGWLKVTSLKSGYSVYVPLPIRLIHQIPDEKGGGCIVRGAHGDESTAKESIVDILTALNGFPINGSVTTWAVAE